MATEGAAPEAQADASNAGTKKRGAHGQGGGDWKRARSEFATGDRGVFFTTVSPGATVNAKRDLIRLLEQAMEEPKANASENTVGSAASRMEDELKELKQTKPSLIGISEVNAKGTGFLKFSGDAASRSPSEVVTKMLEKQRAEFQTTRMAMSSRLLCRVLPIDHTCKPYTDDFKKLAQAVLPAYVGAEAEPTVWALEFKARNTNTLKKEAVLAVIDEIVPKDRHKVSLNDPVKCIMVEVNSVFCGLSVVEHWAKLKKYNLSALTTPEEKKGSAPAAAKAPAPDSKATEAVPEKKDEKPADEVDAAAKTTAA
eukprot:TRINITY_DN18335_c0_g1_i1.p1 TRINITY_DN18335_c0_g1~~TRINITY_DN18335_c0_g1_i1.p1  ORF type:complete len:312 (+),score=99.47 TRINITY_DN18335_c0_g1_i1:202-1137(+)